MGESRSKTPEQGSGYTVVGVVEDGVELNFAVTRLRELGIDEEDLTVVLKRREVDEPEPFPEGTRYIVVPDDSRGLELTIGFAAVFVLTGLFFAFTTPAIGLATFVFFVSLAAILVAGSFTQVGVDPILIEMEAPAEDSGNWSEEFQKGKALVFAATPERRLVRQSWELLRERGADFYVVERRLEPQPVSGAMLHRAAEGEEELAASTDEEIEESRR